MKIHPASTKITGERGRGFLCALSVFVAFCSYGSLAAEQIAEAERIPDVQSNFYEARIRLWMPPLKSKLHGILILLKGTDSDARDSIYERNWQDFARIENLALIGCYFRGDGEPYEDAARGSGEALLRMINELSRSVNCPDLKNAPLVFIGLSSGAMFAYNFANWCPKRTLSFVSMKSGPIDSSKIGGALNIPALFIVGENDSPLRVRSVAEVFAKRQSKTPWTLAVHPQSGHVWSAEEDKLAAVYLKDIFALMPFNDTPETVSQAGVFKLGYTRSLRNPLLSNISHESSDDLVWLPGICTEKLWSLFTSSFSVNDLRANGGKMAAPIVIDPATLDLGQSNFDARSEEIKRTFTVSVMTSAQGKLLFSTDDSKLSVTSDKISQSKYKLDICLQTYGLDAGRYHSSIKVDSLAYPLDTSDTVIQMVANINSFIDVTPSYVYVGVLSRGQITERSLKLHLRQPQDFRVPEIKSSKPDFAQARVAQSQGGSAVLVCHFDGSRGLGNQSGYFNISYGNSEMQKIRVPFIAFVSRDPIHE